MATITNGICTNNKEIDIQSGTTGRISIGTLSGGTAQIIQIGAVSFLTLTQNANAVLNAAKFLNLDANTLSSGGGINIGTLVNPSAINIGTVAASIGITIGNTTGGSNLNLRSGTGAINIGTSIAKTITIGNVTGITTVNIQAGSGAVNITSPTATILSSSIVTAPTDSNTATTAFGTSLTAGTALQNTTGYNLLVNISVNVTAATTATIVMGVGPTSTPTTNTVVASFSTAVLELVSFSAIVPNSYYLLVDTSGTITVASITTQVCPM